MILHWTIEHFILSTSIIYILHTSHDSLNLFLLDHFGSFGGFFCTYLCQHLDRVYFFLLPASSGMKTLTVKSPLSVPYLFFTRMLYLPLSDVSTPVTKKLANLPDSNLRMMCPSVVISLSFFSQVTSGTGSPEMLQVRLRALGEKRRLRKNGDVEATEKGNEPVYLPLLYGDHVRQTACYSSTTCK